MPSSALPLFSFISTTFLSFFLFSGDAIFASPHPRHLAPKKTEALLLPFFIENFLGCLVFSLFAILNVDNIKIYIAAKGYINYKTFTTILQVSILRISPSTK